MWKNVLEYYQSSNWLYKLFCYDSESLAMHYGVWEKGTKNRYEAMINEDRLVMIKGGIKKNMRVLDAGCGVGGSAIHIAKWSGAKVWGITLDPNQVKEAKSNANKMGVGDKTMFAVKDFTKTDYPNNFFDVVYAVESVSHTKPKSKFLREAKRILKPGGRIVICDGYCLRVPKTANERKIVADFKLGFALPELPLIDVMTKEIKKSGFVSVQFESLLEKIGPSIKYFENLANLFAIPALVAKLIPVRRVSALYGNWLALKMAGEAYKIGLAGYGVHTGRKPR